MKSSPAQQLMQLNFLQTSKKLLKPKLAKGIQGEKWKTRTKQAFYNNRNAQDLPCSKKSDTVCIQPMNNPEEPQKKATVEEQVNTVLTEDSSAVRQNRRHLKATPESQMPTIQM